MLEFLLARRGYQVSKVGRKAAIGGAGASHGREGLEGQTKRLHQRGAVERDQTT